jgi:hypothetical protein
MLVAVIVQEMIVAKVLVVWGKTMTQMVLAMVLVLVLVMVLVMVLLLLLLLVLVLVLVLAMMLKKVLLQAYVLYDSYIYIYKLLFLIIIVK